MTLELKPGFAASAAEGPGAGATPWLTIKTIAARVSESVRSAMPPRAGMGPCPLIAEKTAVSSPCLRRGIQAAWSPILGALSTPVWWHLAHCTCTICLPLRSAAGAALLVGSIQRRPDRSEEHTSELQSRQ